MTTFTVPNTVEPDESPVYVAVAGSPRPCVRHALAGHVDDCMCPPSAPSALVALHDPCKTCGGKKGSVTIHNVGTPDVWAYEQECPDCSDTGSTLITLQQECGACIATNPDLCTVCHKPPGRNRNGLVSLPGLYRLTALLPVAHVMEHEPPTPCLIVGRAGPAGPVTELWDGEKLTQVTVHGIPEPGGYVVAMFEKVDD